MDWTNLFTAPRNLSTLRGFPLHSPRSDLRLSTQPNVGLSRGGAPLELSCHQLLPGSCIHMNIKGERMQGCAWVILMHKATLGVEAFSGVHVSVVCWVLQTEVRFYTLLHPHTFDCAAGKEKSEYVKLILKDRMPPSSAALHI